MTLLPMFCRILIDFESLREMVSLKMLPMPNLSKLLAGFFWMSGWSVLFSLLVFWSMLLLAVELGFCIGSPGVWW